VRQRTATVQVRPSGDSSTRPLVPRGLGRNDEGYASGACPDPPLSFRRGEGGEVALGRNDGEKGGRLQTGRLQTRGGVNNFV
jgi:hypothetical protein